MYYSVCIKNVSHWFFSTYFLCMRFVIPQKKFLCLIPSPLSEMKQNPWKQIINQTVKPKCQLNMKVVKCTQNQVPSLESTLPSRSTKYYYCSISETSVQLKTVKEPVQKCWMKVPNSLWTVFYFQEVGVFLLIKYTRWYWKFI